MESLQVYTHEDVDSFVEAYLDNAPREELDPILDRCTENYKELIPEEQILFKSNAKGFVRTYNFLSAILPYGSVGVGKAVDFPEAADRQTSVSR